MVKDDPVTDKSHDSLTSYLEKSGMSLWLNKSDAQAPQLCVEVEDYQPRTFGPDHNCGCGSGSNCSC